MQIKTLRNNKKTRTKMSPSKHIVVLAANAQGHLIPTLAFVKTIAARTSNDYKITIATTPLNAQFIKSNIFSDSSFTASQSKINVAEVQFNSSDHNLPPNIENTDSLPVSQIPILASALYQTLPLEFNSLYESIIQEDGKIPTCVICDVFLGFAIGVAKKFEIPAFGLILSGAFGSTAVKSFWENLPRQENVESDEYTLPGLPEKYRFKSSDLLPFIREADGRDEWSKIFRRTISYSAQCDGWLCNTVEEVEGIGLELLRKQTNSPVWTIGPLIPAEMLKPKCSTSTSSKTFEHHGVKTYGVSPSKCIEWLDLHEQGSVVYISFGSQLTISPFHMMELAKGLEQSRHPFIWVIKPPLGFDKNEEFRPEWLPEKYEERMRHTKQGLLIHGWAPQLEILSHESTGAFLSHCGWSSVQESLSQGVPIIGWPMADDQKYNLAYLMEEMGVCVKLAGGLMSIIMSKEVSKTIDSMMDKSKGKRGEMKEKMAVIVEKMRAAVREDKNGGAKGSSLNAIDDFINNIEERQRTTRDFTHKKSLKGI